MIATKGFTWDLRSVFGNGQTKTCSFRPGETKRVDESKTARNGLHCCENPFDCLSYYSMDGKNRFFRVEAAGDIDEDESGRIACTQITLLEELTPFTFAMEGMKYIINHPHRDRWEQRYHNVIVQQDEAEVKEKDAIAIARGNDPVVKGAEGSILGLIVEDETGIVQCKLAVVSAEQAERWYRLNDRRELEEVR
ncbi:MAG: hypothetical protein K2N01_13250 [Lachnospiraceae bacterium]|nr:hypothetical protein [Lachnospiraceae bacterium]